MSLLLDALKKAAQDKQKAESRQTVDIPVDAAAETADEIILDEELFQTEPGAEDESEALAGNGGDSVTLDEVAEADALTPEEEDLDLELEDGIDLSGDETIEESVQGEVPESRSNVVEPAKEVTPVQASSEKPSSILSTPSPASVMTQGAMRYNKSDARKILQVNQVNYKKKQRIIFYGLFVLAALLFFGGSYFYYTLQQFDTPPALAGHNASRLKPSATISSTQKKDSRNLQTASTDNLNEKNAVTAVKTDNGTVSSVANNREAEKKQNVTTAKRESSRIVISSQKRADPISVLLKRAYAHYKAAEYSEAGQIYKQVLARDQRQRDAMLGLAAIAIKNGQQEQARAWYQRLLQLNPKDSVASAALVDLAKQEVNSLNESQLKLLLRDSPEAAHVHFSLGVLYAKQDRLGESQQSFFTAFSLNKNADYAFNLAVSLDRLGKASAALSYYKKAAELADKSVIHFSEKAVLDRILALEAQQ